ncbi:MAG: AraC family transcriptional regulator [Deltaproteobacteria bacterium]|nr:AraC family transcriptional regulator [Deltaproteobacteria bacterium]
MERHYDSCVYASWALQVLKGQGIDPAPLEAGLGLRLDCLSDPYHMIPTEKLAALMKLSAELASLEDISVQVIAYSTQTSMDLFRFSAVTRPTLGEGLRQSIRNINMVPTPWRPALEICGAQARLINHTSLPACPGQEYLDEFHAALAMMSIRDIIGRDLAPLEVCFRHDDHGVQDAFEKYYRCAVRFGMEQNEVRFPCEWLDYPAHEANPILAERLARLLEEKVRGVSLAPPAFADLVSLIIHQALEQGDCSLEIVSSLLSLQPVSLQYQLKKEGVTFSSLLDSCRKDQVHSLLFREQSLTQVSLALGYRNQAAFSRAFRRWYGVSPREFKQHACG